MHDPDDEGNGTSGAGKTLCENVLALKADLIVSLAQIQLSIRAAGALQVGQVLDLGMVSFDDAQVRTRQGRIVGRGVLGQQDGMRALRLKHRGKKRDAPQRRSSDRGDLAEEHPQDMQFDDFYSVQDLPALPDAGPRNTELSSLGLSGTELADAGPAGGMANPDTDFDSTPMPDMSDLPGFEDDEENGADAISRFKTG